MLDSVVIYSINLPLWHRGAKVEISENIIEIFADVDAFFDLHTARAFLNIRFPISLMSDTNEIKLLLNKLQTNRIEIM